MSADLTSLMDQLSAAGLTLRTEVRPDDGPTIRRIIQDSGFFSEAEAEIAVELVEERLQKGPASGYEFVILESAERMVGYACFGEIPCTVGSYDLYWVAVDPTCQRQGIGLKLVQLVECKLRELKARRVYIETSTRPQYDPTRRFYDRCGYQQVATFVEFYGPGDGKAVYEKVLA